MKNRLSALAACCSLVSLPAHAILDGQVDSNTASSDFAGVGAVINNGSVFSGVLIGEQYVLTAAHILGGAANNPNQVQFRLNNGSPATIAVEEVFIFDGYTGTTAGPDGVWHDDLAIIRLAAPVANAPIYSLYDGDLFRPGFLGLGGRFESLTLAGYGRGGNGTNGATINADAGVRRTGTVEVDKLYIDDDGGDFDDVFQYTFTSGSSHAAGGDSGGPALIFADGEWKVAGVMTFVGSTNGGSFDKFGAIGGGTIIKPYIEWINTVIHPIPEAETWAMMLAGLGLIGVMARRRSRNAA